MYCIGVNLPSHQVGQLDSVLVLASPINDVNIHAWNLNRVTKFMVVEAGIQMELCSVCMGTRKSIITFLISPEFKHDCMRFLLKEVHMNDEPHMLSSDGPMVYRVTHSCSSKSPVSPRPCSFGPTSSLPLPSCPLVAEVSDLVSRVYRGGETCDES